MITMTAHAPARRQAHRTVLPGRHAEDGAVRTADPEARAATGVTIIVPTFNEAANVSELVHRIAAAVGGLDADLVFVDDSTDDTPDRIAHLALTARVSIRLIHRDQPVGGLSGAVLEGIAVSQKRWCLVMDADLQHPPEDIPALLDAGESAGADVVVASRYCADGSTSGLESFLRRLVSAFATVLTRGMFPTRLRDCTDPMTGFFAVRNDSIRLGDLQPRGFKILLEILARQDLIVVEVPFIFGPRSAGKSKASVGQGLRFIRQIAALRFGRLPGFAIIGAFGAVLNLAVMLALVSAGTEYILAAAAGAAVTIITNFLLQERFVFRDLRNEATTFWRRFTLSVGFNAAEAVIRLPVLYLIVQFTVIPSVAAQALTLIAAFLVRFLYHSRVVYRRRGTSRPDRVLPSPTQPRHDRHRGRVANSRPAMIGPTTTTHTQESRTR
jgi:dolichol-phosphate mannosyltransferase